MRRAVSPFVESWSLVVVFSLVALAACSKPNTVVVYCALDRVYAEPVLKIFQDRTGITVKAQYDVEKTKTIGLVKSIEDERDRPRCDVFWNSEILHTLRLQRQGLLAAYDPESAKDIPAAFRDKDGYWHGFAARARILIVNTEKLPDPKDWPHSFRDVADPKWKGKAAFAKPLAGTPQTHVAALYARLGEAETDAYLAAALNNEVTWTVGNEPLARLVATGAAWFGFADTDDYHAQLVNGAKVAVVYPDDPAKVAGGIGTLVIPNTVAIIKSGPNPDNAKQLVEFLLSELVERELANCDSVQVPVRASIPTPDSVKRLDQFAPMAVDWWKVADEFDRQSDRVAAMFVK